MIYKTSVNEYGAPNSNAQLEKLIARIADGEIDALGPLYEATRVTVYSFALSILRNAQDAEDVMHDCFVKIVDSSQLYTPQGKPLAWILTITRNLCMNRMRQFRKNTDFPEDWERVEADEGVSAEDSLVLRQCMEHLSDDERQIVILHAVSSMKHRQIAEFLSLPLSTVLSKYNRAIKKLKKDFLKEN